MKALASSDQFKAGNPETVNEYYLTVFGTTFKNQDDLKRLDLNLTQENIISGRAIEDKIMEGLYWTKGFTIIPKLKKLKVPALIIHGSNDYIPLQSSRNIADAIEGAKLVNLEGSGHFSFIDCNEQVHKALDDFFRT